MKHLTPCLLTLLATSQGLASGHAEAPAIAHDPAADTVDLFAFQARSPRSETHLALVLTVFPGCGATGGALSCRFDDGVLYEFMIDNDGDARENVTYQFRFTTHPAGVDPSSPAPDAVRYDASKQRFTHAYAQTYTVHKVVGERRGGEATEIARGPVAPPRPADSHPGGQTPRFDDDQLYRMRILAATVRAGDYVTFAGPRDDPFFGTRDPLEALRPSARSATDAFRDRDVLTIALEVPTHELLGADAGWLGIWATTSRPQVEVLRLGGKEPRRGGSWVQVSRTGNPLVSAMFLPPEDRDRFNAGEPKDDLVTFGLDLATPRIVKKLAQFPVSRRADQRLETIADVGRSDLVDVFLRGIPGFNRLAAAVASGDMLRVDLRLSANRQHWPLSGRAPADDVTTTALQLVAQCSQATHDVFGRYGRGSRNCSVDDGVSLTAAEVPSLTFPYLRLPQRR